MVGRLAALKMMRTDAMPPAVPTPRLLFVIGMAMVLFAVLFATGGRGTFDFWWGMSALAALLTGSALWMDRSFPAQLREDARRGLLRALGWGVFWAAALYAVFFIGNLILRSWFGDSGGAGIDRVYALKSGVNTTRIALLIAFVIGPAEEFFWRAFLQRQLSARLGATRGVTLAVLLYASAHVSSGNPALILAALVCGIFWGILYARMRSVWINVASHTIWDLAVFLWFPFT